ncbi:MAG: SpoIIE family protein phosphatase [Streptosporangiaceae bacterium]
MGNSPSARPEEDPLIVTAASNGDFHRLSALIARQRQDLDRMQAEAASRSVVDLARGMLMARLGHSPAQAQEQLVRLSRDARTTVADLAAQITGQQAVAGAAGPAPVGAIPVGSQEREGQSAVPLAAAAAEVARDGDEIAATMLGEVLAPAGAAAVALWLIEPDGGLELAGAAGFDPREVRRWRRIHPDMDTATQQAIHTGLDSFWPAGLPRTESLRGIGRWPQGARAALPLSTATAYGAMEICWPEPMPEFPNSLRRLLVSLADLSQQTLGGRLRSGGITADRRTWWAFGILDSLPGSALFAEAVRDDRGRLVDLRIRHLSAEFADPAGRPAEDLAGRTLLEMYPAAALPGGLFDCATEVLATGERRAMSGTVISAPPGGRVAAPVMEAGVAPLYDGVVIAWRPPAEAERLTALLEQAQRLGRIGCWEEDLRTGEVFWTDPAFGLFGQARGAPVPITELDGHVPADDIAAVQSFRDALLTEQREVAVSFRVIRADDHSVRQMRAFAVPVTDSAGTLITIRGAYQDVSAGYHTHVAFAAARDRLADSEERAAVEHQLALRLQRAITPLTAAPVPTPGLDVTARYRPAGPANLVSGDWYDTVALPNGQIFLAVGDIAGHGVEAVTGMVILRNCLRGLAITGAGPAALLSWLNKIAFYLTNGILSTAVCGLYDPPARSLRWARAGHLPPVLVRGGIAETLPLLDGVMLGAEADASYQEGTLSLEPADTLVMFTDGLIERHAEAIDDSLDALLGLASGPVTDIADFADYLLSTARSDTSDDACLVALQVRDDGMMAR